MELYYSCYGRYYEQKDLDTVKLLAEKQAMENIQESICSSLWLYKDGCLVETSTETWNSDPKQNTMNIQDWRQLEWFKLRQSQRLWCTERHEAARHTVSTALTQEESFLYIARKGFVLTWLLLGPKRILVKGSQFCTYSISKSIFLRSELLKIMTFQDLRAYVLKCFNKKKFVRVPCTHYL